ncbi:MATE family efflux transporter [[Mycoplasma] anseris]|uniref:Probable multidrug resistance protein NorM n=1 Tax=[Mycoplasma] anseris TaxID=92400 RepID=A0A2Z4NDI3_9BACT|nr:MATE family efflux transporter [[Mycoplasma] anseris]AWX69566.1 hypothetical protein DP065_02265 [[Mycoplasma] anseris]
MKTRSVNNHQQIVNNKLRHFFGIKDFKKIFKLVLPIFIQILVLDIITLATALATTLYNRVYHIDGSYNGAYFYMFSKILNIYKIVTFIPIIYQLGVLVVASNLFGQEKFKEIPKLIASACWVSLILNLSFYLLVFFLSPFLLNWAGAKHEMLIGFDDKESYTTYLNNVNLAKINNLLLNLKDTLFLDGGSYLINGKELIFNKTNYQIIQQDELNFAIKFFKITIIDLFIFSIAQILVAGLQGIEKNKEGMVAVVISLITKLIWTYTLLFGIKPNNVMMYVSLETVVGAFAQLVVAWIFCSKHIFNKWKISIKETWHNNYIKKMFLIGLPIAIENGIWFTSQYFVANAIPFAKLDEKYIGMYRAMTNVYDIFTGYVFALSFVTNVLVSIEVGKNNHQEAYLIGNSCFKLGIYSQIIWSILGIIFTWPMLKLFSIDNQTINQIGYTLIFVAMIRGIADVGNLTTLRGLWSTGDVWIPNVVAIITMIGIQISSTYLIVYYAKNVSQDIKFLLIIASMGIDPLLRSILFKMRWISKKWTKYAIQI